MRVIGITGGIGSGKSSVSGVLKELGAVIIDADIIAREVVGKGQKALEEITEIFGKQVLNEYGELDRKKVADIVFNDSEKLKMLNMITHKYVVENIFDSLNKAREENTKIVVLDVPIPIEHGFLDVADEIWVVSADIQTRVKRVMVRSGFTQNEALDRINSQKNDKEYFALADEIIYNNGSLVELESIVKELGFKKGLF